MGWEHRSRSAESGADGDRPGLPTPASSLVVSLPASASRANRQLVRMPFRYFAPTRRDFPRSPFAPLGERSIGHAYRKVLARARRLIYVEDQYLWAAFVADLICRWLCARPALTCT